MLTRRRFLERSSLLAASLLLARRTAHAAQEKTGKPAESGRAERSLKLLILGGTGFLGPCVVRRAIERGHVMTLFNRGKTDPNAFKELENVRGDRNVSSDLEKLAGRDWDGVVDTSGYFPRQTRESAGLLASHVSQYVFVSTISVYAPLEKAGMDESAPLLRLKAGTDVDSIKTIGPNYGALKALCEEAAEKEMPGQVTNVRPGLIVGPGDETDRYTYWPVRVSKGGEVLAPGTPDDPVQMIDVRDLANFVVGCLERSVVGVFNAVGPKGGLPICRMLESCRTVSGSDASFTFVPDEFLAEQQISEWSDMPTWVSPRGPESGVACVSIERALAAGMKLREPVETAKATLDWYRGTQKGRALNAGLTREREEKALAAWHEKSKRK